MIAKVQQKKEIMCFYTKNLVFINIFISFAEK